MAGNGCSLLGRVTRALSGGDGSSEATSRQVAFWVTAGVGLPIVAGAVWYYLQDTYYYYTPVEVRAATRHDATPREAARGRSSSPGGHRP